MAPNPFLQKLGYSDNELKKFIEQEDLKLIGYRQIRNAIRR